VLSLGSRGAVASFAGSLVEALAPRIDAVSPIGAGDALSAAYTWASSSKNGRPATPEEALRWGVAAGTASARLPGMNYASLAQTEEIHSQVELRRVE
jgi:6-phosphofructokinase 2